MCKTLAIQQQASFLASLFSSSSSTRSNRSQKRLPYAIAAIHRSAVSYRTSAHLKPSMSIVQAQKKRRGNNEVAVRLPSSSIATSGPGSGLRALQEEDDEEPRTSSLQAPIMLLSGQDAPVYGVKFSPNGDVLASAGAEKAIYLWEVYGDCANYNVLRGHQNAILDLSFFRDGRTLATASADKSGALWDAHKGKRKRKLPCSSIANACCAGAMDDHVAIACDDGSVLLWDARQRKPAKQLQTQYALCAVALEGSENRVFAGGLDNVIRGWDLRTDEVVLELKGHGDTVTGLSLSPDGSRLLSNSMDSTLKAWDVAPFSPSERCVATFEGHSHDFHKNLLRCSWSHDGEKVACGSADQIVHVWDVASTEELYYLPGHKGAVTEVDFHPKEPILASSSSDTTVYLGEIA